MLHKISEAHNDSKAFQITSNRSFVMIFMFFASLSLQSFFLHNNVKCENFVTNIRIKFNVVAGYVKRNDRCSEIRRNLLFFFFLSSFGLAHVWASDIYEQYSELLNCKRSYVCVCVCAWVCLAKKNLYSTILKTDAGEWC